MVNNRVCSITNYHHL